VPLGHFRMRVIELLQLVIKLKKPTLVEAMVETNAFKKISGIVERYPWHNFVQLKVIGLYEEILENGENLSQSLKSRIFEGSGIAEALINLQKVPNFNFDSENKTRNGFMAVVTKIGNMLNKNSEKPELVTYLESEALAEGWKAFV
jgi:hypothetical protein